MFNYQLYQGLENFKDAHLVRTAVFVEEQGFIDEFDELDKTALHIVIYHGEKPVATGRTYPNGKDTYSIGRIAVLKEYRKNKLGKMVVQTLEDVCRKKDVKFAKLSAQIQAQGFYEKLGYQCAGEEYLEEHVPHIEMTKSLTPIF